MSGKYPSQLAEQFQVRLPPGSRAQLKARAAAGGRSMNTEIVMIIQAALSDSDDERLARIEAKLDAFLAR